MSSTTTKTYSTEKSKETIKKHAVIGPPELQYLSELGTISLAEATNLIVIQPLNVWYDESSKLIALKKCIFIKTQNSGEETSDSSNSATGGTESKENTSTVILLSSLPAVYLRYVVGSLFGLKKCNSTIESVLYGVLNVCIKHGSNEDATDNTSNATGAATTWSKLRFSTRCIVANRLIGVLFSSQYISYLHQWNSRTKKRRFAQGSSGGDGDRQNDARLDTPEAADNDMDDTDDDDPQLWQSFANAVNDDSSPLHSSLLEPHGDAHVFKQTFQEILENDSYQAELAHLPLSLAATAAAASGSSGSGEVAEPNIAWQELRRLYDDLVVVQSVMLQNLPSTVPLSDCNMILFADWARTYTNMTDKLSNLNALYFFAQCMSHKLNYSGLERTKNAMAMVPAPVVPMALGAKKKPTVIDMTVKATTAASSTATVPSVAAAAAASATASTTVKQHITGSAVSSNLHASRSDHEDATFAKSMKKMLAEESNRWDNRIATLFSDLGTSGQSATQPQLALQARIDTHVRLLQMAQKREVQYTKLYMKASSRKKASGNGESSTGTTMTENDSTFVDDLLAKMKDAAYRVQRYQVELDTLHAQQQSQLQQQQPTNHTAGAMPSSSSPSAATGGPSIQQWSIPLVNRKRGANHLSSI